MSLFTLTVKKTLFSPTLQKPKQTNEYCFPLLHNAQKLHHLIRLRLYELAIINFPKQLSTDESILLDKSNEKRPTVAVMCPLLHTFYHLDKSFFKET